MKLLNLLLYCTKANKYERLVRDEHYGKPFYLCGAITENFESLNGKIVAECDFEVEEIKYRYDTSAYKCNNINDYYYTNTLNFKQLEERSCLTNKDLLNYLGQNDGYAIHIKNLHIFDKPKELNEVYSIKHIGGGLLATDSLKKAPQNMMRVSDNKWDYGCAHFDDICIVISIRPEWLCKILNGEKTIEVRKVVLKEMLK